MEEIIAQFSGGKFHIDCPHIEVRQRGKESKFYFSGPGYIYLDGDIIKLKMYSQGETSCRLTISEKLTIDFPSASAAGRIIPEDHYYDLVAKDVNDRRWSSEYIRIHVNFSMADDSAIATGQLRSVSLEREMDPRVRGQSLSLYFQNKPDYPSNVMTKKEVKVGDFRTQSSSSWNAVEVGVGGIKHYIESTEYGLTVCTTCPLEILHKNLHARISEALSFAFGEEFRPFAIRTVMASGDTLRLMSGEKHIPRPSYPPFRDRYNHDMSVWNLFMSYLNFCMPYQGDGLHPISSHVFGAIRAQGASLDAYALSLALAVEGVAKIELGSLTLADATFVAEIDKLSSLIESSDASDRLKDRAKGALEAMKRPRAEDRLKAAAGKGIIDGKLVPVWKNLRNAHAHADIIDFGKAQSVLDKCGAARTLLNQIVFHVINYSGPYTNYSVTGWPTEHYESAARSVGENSDDAPSAPVV